MAIDGSLVSNLLQCYHIHIVSVPPNLALHRMMGSPSHRFDDVQARQRFQKARLRPPFIAQSSKLNELIVGIEGV